MDLGALRAILFGITNGQDKTPEQAVVDAIDLPLIPGSGIENTVRPSMKFGVDLMNALGKPFESKSRYHFDPITWEILQK